MYVIHVADFAEEISEVVPLGEVVLSAGETTMAMKKPPHPGRSVRENCLVGHSFVLAHQGSNSGKSDLLAAAEHLERPRAMSLCPRESPGRRTQLHTSGLGTVL